MARLAEGPPRRVIAADPVWNLAVAIQADAESAKALRDERFATVLSDIAAKLRAAVEAGTVLEDLSTAEAAELLRMEPDSVATACRRGRITGARKVAGQWRIPANTLTTGRAA